jgi:hypothetical protein
MNVQLTFITPECDWKRQVKNSIGQQTRPLRQSSVHQRQVQFPVPLRRDIFVIARGTRIQPLIQQHTDARAIICAGGGVVLLCRPVTGEIEMKAFIVVLSALLFLVMAALHAYRAYAGIPVEIGHHALPIMASWICTGVTGVLGILLLILRK